MGLKEKITDSRLWKTGRSKLMSMKLKNGASLYLVIKTFLKHVFDPNLNILACGIAFNILMSLFPGIIFLFTLVPFLLPYIDLGFIDPNLVSEQDLNLQQQVDIMLKELLPESLYEFISETISDIVSKEREGLLSIGFFFAFYLSTNAMIAIMDSFNHFYQTKESRNWFQKRGIALMLTLMLALVMILTIIVFVFGNIILDQLLNFHFIQDYAAYLILGLRYLVIGILFFIIISSIYFFAPAVKRRFSFFSPGSFIATVMIIIVSQAFAYYVNNFGSYNKLYGSIGALVGLMVLFYVISYMILLGFQINASVDGALEVEQKQKNSQ